MVIREKLEKAELMILSKHASFSSRSMGRRKDELPCRIRTSYQRDRDRILHSKSFRRLKHKTQVFISPEGDHYRTRLTHTLEVSQISRTIAKALALNEDLTEAISLGHDLGHTPFGHAGERFLNSINIDGFKHNIQSLRVVDFLESGNGLNLTYETRDGILNHTGDAIPKTLEGQVVKLSDRIAYINHDIDDALRSGIIKETDLPREHLEKLGFSHSLRINTMVEDIIYNSMDKNFIMMSKNVESSMNGLRNFMFENFYNSRYTKIQEDKAWKILSALFDFFYKNIDLIPEIDRLNYKNYKKDMIVTDYIAGMTDRYAENMYKKITEV